MASEEALNKFGNKKKGGVVYIKGLNAPELVKEVERICMEKGGELDAK